MILVTVGTNEARFDRLLEAFSALPVSEELLVQHGPSPVRPAGARCVDYLLFDELLAQARVARIVVTHAGVGSVLTALTAGRRPVVVPRLARFGEAVDDHQLAFAERLSGLGLVRLVADLEELPVALAESGESDGRAIVPDPRLVSDLKLWLAPLVRGRERRFPYST